jgi:hypothetical protein
MSLNASTAFPLSKLPNEIPLEVFYTLSTVKDVINLAQSCSSLYRLFSGGKNRISNFGSAAGVPKKPDYEFEQKFSGKYGPSKMQPCAAII